MRLARKMHHSFTTTVRRYATRTGETSRFVSITLAAVALFISGCDQQSAQPDTAAMEAASGAYKTCAACHGATGLGNRAMQAPSLVNLDPWYVSRQLENFRSGVRGKHPKDAQGMQMASQASLLRDDQAVEAVAREIDSFPNKAPDATFEANPDTGRDRYNMTCGACHGPEAVGNQALNAPSLRGIDDWYLVRQYENFREGIRGTHADDTYGQQMQRMGQVLESEQDMKDVAAWLQSLGIND